VLRETGEQVAIKVQRPGIGESISIDMLLLRRLMGAVDNNLPQVGLVLGFGLGFRGVCKGGCWRHSRWLLDKLESCRASGATFKHGCPYLDPTRRRIINHQRTHWQISQPLVPLVDEFAARLFGELDYVQEGKNAEKFQVRRFGRGP